MQEPQIIHEDEAIMVIDKPAGWVAHEGAGEHGETVVVDWFVKNHPEVMAHAWPDLSRVGIVHRLDKDTSGIMVIAKTPEALTELQQQFQERTTDKQYLAILYGEPRDHDGRIETFIGRHPKRRQEQAVLPIQIGERARREAITEYVVEKIAQYKKQSVTLMRFYPKTGRMHQLRVHAKYLGTPILGDPVYNIKHSKRLSKELDLTRQMLHAERLTFRHPTYHKRVTFVADLPTDMKNALTQLGLN